MKGRQMGAANGLEGPVRAVGGGDRWFVDWGGVDRGFGDGGLGDGFFLGEGETGE